MSDLENGETSYGRLPSKPMPTVLTNMEISNLHDPDEVCTDHVHRSSRSPWLRALVLGANDGLVSTAALLMGVGAGTADLATLRLTGVAGLLAGALSMAVGEYISVAAQRESERADIKQEEEEQEKGPEARAHELRELALIYERRGLPADLSMSVAEALTRHDVIRAHARDELGIDIDDLANPLQAAIVSGICFSTGSAIPLLSAAFISDSSMRLVAIALSTTVGLLIFGYLGSALGGSSVWKGMMRVIIGGWLALGVTYGIGMLFDA